MLIQREEFIDRIENVCTVSVNGIGSLSVV